MIGGEIGRPVANSTGPGTPMPMPHSRPGTPCVVATSWSNSSSTRSRHASGPASIDAGSSWWPRIRPSSVVTATSMLVAPRSATRTWPASARNVSCRGGRPPVLRPDVALDDEPALDAARRPAGRRSPARDRSASTSSERDRDRPSRISSRTTTSASSASSGSGAGQTSVAASSADHAAMIRASAVASATFALDRSK